MPKVIPEDVLREIVECAVTQPGEDDPPFLRSLASTNKLFHAIAIPHLFRSLRFDNKVLHDDAPSAPLIKMTRAYNRARSLYCSPHLLKHVSEFILDKWSQKTPGSSGTTIVDMVYECVVMLIERMLALRHVKVSSSPIILPLLRLLCSSPQIHRVSLFAEPAAPDVDIPSDLPISRHIRHFSYRPTSVPLPMDVYFRVIVERCNQDLQTLELPYTELPKITSLVSQQYLSLGTLAVYCNGQSHELVQDVWNLLPPCAELRGLIIHHFDSNRPPHDLAPEITPYLEIIRVPRALVPTLTVGRAIKKVHVSGHTDITLWPVREIAGYSAALRELTLSAVTIDTYKELVAFIRSLDTYPSLDFLKIVLLPRTGGVYLKRKMSPRVHGRFTDALRRLRTLRVCIIAFALGSLNPAEVISTEIICPAGKIGDREDRGHPSLEIMWVGCICERWWVWYHAEGWQCVQYPYNSQYSEH